MSKSGIKNLTLDAVYSISGPRFRQISSGRTSPKTENILTQQNEQHITSKKSKIKDLSQR